DRREPCAVVAELDGALDIVLGRGTDHLADAGSMDQAGANPRRERASGEGENRYTHPHRVRGCGGGSIREAVEKQVGQWVTGEMLRIGKLVGEDNALRIDAAADGGLAQPVVGFGDAAQEPQ